VSGVYIVQPPHIVAAAGVGSIWAKGAVPAITRLDNMIRPNLSASSSIDAAKTTRLTPHHNIALIHIGRGSPEV